MSQTHERPALPAEPNDGGHGRGQPDGRPDGHAGHHHGASSPWRAAALLVGMGVLVVLSMATGSCPGRRVRHRPDRLVMLHEPGHFVTAKWAGMKVTEFFFGFGPRLWSFRKGETEYGVKAIPAGGYVKIIGMSNLEEGIDPVDEARTYRQKSYPKRMLVAVAGIVTHFVLAFLILMLMWTVVGVPNDDKPTLAIGAISSAGDGPSPAEDAGFKVGDRIVAVDGQAVTGGRSMPRQSGPSRASR